MKLCRKWCLLFLSIAIFFCFRASFAQGPDTPPGVTTVVIRPQQVGFYVLDKKGDRVFVDDLSRERFRISEKVRGKGWHDPEVKSVFNGEQPLLLALVLDTSQSVFLTEAGPVKKTLQDFVRGAMRQKKDAAILMPFGMTVDNGYSFTSDPGMLFNDIGKLTGGDPGTALFDALLTAVWRLEDEEAERGVGEYRKAIILLTDGQENASRIQPEKFGGDEVKAHIAKRLLVEERVLDSDIPVYVLYTNLSDQERVPLMIRGVWNSPQTSGEWLRNIARNTGGTFFPFMEGRQRRTAFARIIEELAHKYWLLFYAAEKAPGEELREIRIEVVKTGENGKIEKDKRYKVIAPPRFYLQK